MEALIGLVAVGGFWLFLIVAVLSKRSSKIWESQAKMGFAPQGGSAPTSDDSTQMLTELRRMEDRVRTLERILDSDFPGWRNRL
jgi:phage shock protein B